MISSGSAVSSENSFGVFNTLLSGTKHAKSAFDLFSNCGAKSIGIIVDAGFVDQTVNICEKNSTLDTAKMYPSIEVFGYFELPSFASNGGADYVNSLTVIMTTFKSNSVETILGCSFEHLCVEVYHYFDV